MTVYLDPEQALAVVDRLGFRIRDRGLLFSALARPAASAFGEDAYASVDLKAAALLSSLTQNHALFDGNKRLAWYLTLAFLRLNGYLVVLDESEAFSLILDAAQGRRELPEIASTLASGLTRSL